MFIVIVFFLFMELEDDVVDGKFFFIVLNGERKIKVNIFYRILWNCLLDSL